MFSFNHFDIKYYLCNYLLKYDQLLKKVTFNSMKFFPKKLKNIFFPKNVQDMFGPVVLIKKNKEVSPVFFS